MALDLSFTTLAEIAEAGGGGKPIEIPLREIVEDPNQPRHVFDEAELNDLAASIRERGILQAISVTPKNAAGKHVIVFGARRFRAAQLAGLERIKAVIEDAEHPDAYLQIIENIQRDDLRPVEIAAFVTGRIKAGDKVGDIAKRLGKPKDYISRYAAVAKMPPFLQAKLETSPIRAVYELYLAWREQPAAVERACSERESFTDAQARDFVRKLRASTHQAGAEGLPETPGPAGDVASSMGAANGTSAVGDGASRPEAVAATATARKDAVERNLPRTPLALIVRHEERIGQLLLDKPASQGPHHAVVAFGDDGEQAELPLAELSLIELRPN